MKNQSNKSIDLPKHQLEEIREIILSDEINTLKSEIKDAISLNETRISNLEDRLDLIEEQLEQIYQKLSQFNRRKKNKLRAKNIYQ